VPETIAANTSARINEPGLNIEYATKERTAKFKTKKIIESFSAEEDIASNCLNLNFELESKTTIARVMTASEVRRTGGNWIIGFPLYLIRFNPIPISMRRRKFDIFNLIETSVESRPIRNIIPIKLIYSNVWSNLPPLIKILERYLLNLCFCKKFIYLI